MFHPFWTFVYGLVIGGIVMFLVYRNNAKKFKELEKQIKAKGKTINDLLS